MLKNIENQSGGLSSGIKRTADDMIQYVGNPITSPSTDTVASDTQSDTENYTAKRVRMSDESQITGGVPDKLVPSRVIHVRNLPQDTSESEIMQLAACHGQVTNLILMRNKRQAFVEMHDLKQAMSFVRCHQQHNSPALIRNQQVQLQYSATYTELKPGQRSHANGMKPTPVLHVNVDSHLVPVSLALFNQLFSRFGTVLKIITFTKNNQFQALVQMSDVESAGRAKQELDGKNIFLNCCMLRIDFSKMISINVKYNNEKSRDFTNPDLPSGEGGAPHIDAAPPTIGQMAGLASGPVGMCLPVPQALNATPMVNAYPAMKGLRPFRMLSGVNPAMMQGFGLHPPNPVSAATPLNLRALQLSPARLSLGQQADSSSSSTHLHQIIMSQLGLQGTRLAAPIAMPALSSANSIYPTHHISVPNVMQLPQALPNTGSTGPQQEVKEVTNQKIGLPTAEQHQQILLSQLQQQQLMQQQYMNQAVPFMSQVSPANMAAGEVGSPSPPSAGNSVVLVSNLNAQKVSPDALFTLFGMYGDVMRVKILYHRLDTALIQYADKASAISACNYLDKVTFWQTEVRVIMSKYNTIQMPSDGASPEGQRLTKDYTTSDLHRYRKLGTRNLSNIYAPSATLHLANLPEPTEEQTLVKEFSNYGTVVAFKFFVKDRRMALIQMGSIMQGVEALMGMHNFTLNHSHHMRVSFSKSPIQS
ncbi:polypyrimidine tract-binding protein 1-like [Watersipora subatra]|uniref:polypyrimidine tract-binding protein 1-like n=1 Tax=Watersipora subatra TaxID=2589382 RepID=UPI00355C47AA